MSTGLAVSRRVTALDHGDAVRAGGTRLQEVHPALFGQLGIPNIWKRVRLTAQWDAAYRFIIQAGALVVGEVRVYPHEDPHVGGPWEPGDWSGLVKGCHATVPPGGLTTTVARMAASLAPQLVEAQRDVAWSRAEVDLARRQGLAREHDPFSPEGLWGELGVTEPDQVTGSPVRRTRALQRQARAAKLYVDAYQRGVRAPVEVVAQRLGVTYSTALWLVHAARQNDLLLPKVAIRGRPNGQLTRRALRLLEAAAAPKSHTASHRPSPRRKRRSR